jgi:hypothetical protein
MWEKIGSREIDLKVKGPFLHDSLMKALFLVDPKSLTFCGKAAFNGLGGNSHIT